MEKALSVETLKHIEHKTKELISSTILDPDFRFSVDGIEILMKKDKPNLSKHPVICIKVSTNNRSLLLGQLMYFPIDGIRGFYNGEMEMYLAGYLEGKLATKSIPEIHIEATPMKDVKNYHYTYKYLTLKEAITHNILPEDCPLVKKMKEYSLDYVLLEGSIVAGPDFDLIAAVETFVKKHKPRRFIDLFCGTGSLTKVALLNGVDRATCVDSDTSVARKNLMDLENKVSIIEEDAFTYAPDEPRYDLVVADPFLDLSHRVAEKLCPKYRKICNTFMLTMGYTEDLYWTKKVALELRKWFRAVSVLDYGRLVQAICQ
jgi:hypothetical protein